MGVQEDPESVDRTELVTSRANANSATQFEGIGLRSFDEQKHRRISRAGAWKKHPGKNQWQ